MVLSKKEREQYERKALRMWGFHGNSKYREPLTQYHLLKATKEEIELELNGGEVKPCNKKHLELTGVPKVKAEDVADYPNIPFLDTPTEVTARNFLAELNDWQLCRLVEEELCFEKLSHSYKNITLWNKKALRAIEKYQNKKSGCDDITHKTGESRKYLNPANPCLHYNSKAGGCKWYHFMQ